MDGARCRGGRVLAPDPWSHPSLPAPLRLEKGRRAGTAGLACPTGVHPSPCVRASQRRHCWALGGAVPGGQQASHEQEGLVPSDAPPQHSPLAQGTLSPCTSRRFRVGIQWGGTRGGHWCYAMGAVLGRGGCPTPRGSGESVPGWDGCQQQESRLGASCQGTGKWEQECSGTSYPPRKSPPPLPISPALHGTAALAWHSPATGK